MVEVKQKDRSDCKDCTVS